MTLRVQARDSAMNIFASCAVAEDIAIQIASEWVQQCPALIVEVVGVYE